MRNIQTDERPRMALDNRAELRAAEDMINAWRDTQGIEGRISLGSQRETELQEPMPLSFVQTKHALGGLTMLYEQREYRASIDWTIAGGWLVKMNKLDHDTYRQAMKSAGHMAVEASDVVTELMAAEDAGSAAKVYRLGRKAPGRKPDKTAA